ncbi:hypothetical protein I3843_03G174500 [Carya illinoinensis]|nr:hypothetical protein I3843_03G174500 [Carya illinoinensis]
MPLGRGTQDCRRISWPLTHEPAADQEGHSRSRTGRWGIFIYFILLFWTLGVHMMKKGLVFILFFSIFFEFVVGLGFYFLFPRFSGLETAWGSGSLVFSFFCFPVRFLVLSRSPSFQPFGQLYFSAYIFFFMFSALWFKP